MLNIAARRRWISGYKPMDNSNTCTTTHTQASTNSKAAWAQTPHHTQFVQVDHPRPYTGQKRTLQSVKQNLYTLSTGLIT